VYSLDADTLSALRGDLLVPDRMVELVPEAQQGSFEQKVLEAFVEGSTLVRIPSSRKKRDVVLDWLVQRFPLGEVVSEAEVNERIQEAHWDSATLRRELVGGGWMSREAGRYTRLR
jgi:hypothetical protein